MKMDEEARREEMEDQRDYICVSRSLVAGITSCFVVG